MIVLEIAVSVRLCSYHFLKNFNKLQFKKIYFDNWFFLAIYDLKIDGVHSNKKKI